MSLVRHGVARLKEQNQALLIYKRHISKFLMLQHAVRFPSRFNAPMLKFGAKRFTAAEIPDAETASYPTRASLINVQQRRYLPQLQATSLRLPSKAHIPISLPLKSQFVPSGQGQNADARLGSSQQMQMQGTHPPNTEKAGANNWVTRLLFDRYARRGIAQRPISFTPADADPRSNSSRSLNKTKSVAPQFHTRSVTYPPRTTNEVTDLTQYPEHDRDQIHVSGKPSFNGMAMGSQPVSGRADPSNGIASQVANANQASTIHLDGSALGRWALLHLERALTKPPSGMTGVDPRATIPRSRVVPF